MRQSKCGSTRTHYSETVQAVLRAKRAAVAIDHAHDRFEIYRFLKSIYRAYRVWKREKIVKASVRLLMTEAGITKRKGMSPIRVLIEATLPTASSKQKSRWVRALEYISSENVRSGNFRRFVRANGGLAGCARLAAEVDPKRRRLGDAWIERQSRLA